MTGKSVLQVVDKCIPKMRLSQKKTLSTCVYGCLRSPAGRLTSMARGMGGSVSLRDRLKRVSRFLGNDRVQIEAVAPSLLKWILGRQGPLFPIVVLMDWTEEHGKHVLMLSLKWKKRSIPFFWYSVDKSKLSRSRNSTEYIVLRLLRSWVPEDRKLIVVADRGFPRSRLFQFFQKNKMDYIVRLPKSTHVISRGYRGSLGRIRVLADRVRDFKKICVGADAQVPMRVVVKKARIKREWTTWYLATSLTDERKETIVSYYERRMGIEATFKDLKTTLGWRFQTRIESATRLSRYLLILVLALICAWMIAERKLAKESKHLVALSRAFRGSTPVSFVQLGLWIIQNFADQLTMFSPRSSWSHAA